MNFIIAGMLSLSVFSIIPSKTIEYIAEPQEQIEVELSIEGKIIKSATEYGLNVETMLRIADAESDFKNVPNYKYTDEDGRYTAYGPFMITRTTYKEYCSDNVLDRMDIDKNIDCAMKIATKSGLHHWNESRTNWN